MPVKLDFLIDNGFEWQEYEFVVIPRVGEMLLVSSIGGGQQPETYYVRKVTLYTNDKPAIGRSSVARVELSTKAVA